MSDPAQIEQELKAFLEIEENIRKVDRIHYLMAIVNKHFGTDKIDHVIVSHDLTEIINRAKGEHAKTSVPMYISKKEVRDLDFNYVLIMECFIGYLNKNKLLKRLVKFDYGR